VLQSTILAAGPLREISARLPIGSYEIYAEIFEEAGAYAPYVIKKQIDLLIPDQAEYEAFDIGMLHGLR
jgi:hypothetical protein